MEKGVCVEVEPSTAPTTSSKPVDVFACGFGLVTSLLTGLVLWWIAGVTGFAFYKSTYFFVIPMGAFLSGWIAASGYYLAYQIFQRRPGRLLLPNILSASIGTFLLINVLSYVVFRARMQQLRIPVSFWTFLDISIRSTRINVMGMTTLPKLGYFGYITTGLEILGFAAGGLSVYSFLRSQNYCNRCSWRLTFKGRRIRYSARNHGMDTIFTQVVAAFHENDPARGLQLHQDFGSYARYRDSSIRSVSILHTCKHCGLQAASFVLERRSGERWIRLDQTRIEAVSDTPLTISR